MQCVETRCRCAVSGIPGYLQHEQGGSALVGALKPLEVDGIELSDIRLKRVIHIVLTIRMAPDCGEVSIGSAAAGGQQHASVSVFAESIENGFCGGEEHYPFANEGSALSGEAVMIKTMEGKISPRCAEIRGVQVHQVQVCSIQLQVGAGVGVHFIGSQAFFAPEHVVGMDKAVELRLWFPVELGLSRGAVWERRRPGRNMS
jgi:hypothetical protein